MNHYTVDILTPDKVVAKGIPAESLLIPTLAGQINVLADHTHIVSKLETGMISVFGGPDDPDRFYSVTTGICKVLDGKITILSNSAHEDHELDLETAKAELHHAQEMLEKETLDDHELEATRHKVEIAKLHVQLAEQNKDRKNR